MTTLEIKFIVIGIIFVTIIGMLLIAFMFSKFCIYIAHSIKNKLCLKNLNDVNTKGNDS